MDTTDSNLPQFSCYDVFLMPLDKNKVTNRIRLAPGKFVGNRRFEVLLGIYRPKFAQAQLFGDEKGCQDVIQEVIETVTLKCVPNGRFFEKIGPENFKQIESGEPTTQLIRSALEHPPASSYEVPLKEESYEERPRKRVCKRSSDITMLCKTAQNVMALLNRRSSDMALWSKSSGNYVASPAPFDVVCEPHSVDALPEGHVGNNRLRVLFDIRRSKFEEADEEGKQAIVEEIVNSITNDASSKFLQFDHLSGMYKRMGKGMSLVCIRNCMEAYSLEKGEFQSSTRQSLFNRKNKRSVLDRIEHRKNGQDFQNLPLTFKTLQKRKFTPAA